MSDTKTVREKCKHNQYEGHFYRNPDYPGDGRPNPKFITKELFCKGGKEIEMFAMRLHSFNGGLWQFHMVDDPTEDGEPTHWAMALEVVEE